MVPAPETKTAILRVGDGRGFLMDAGPRQGVVIVTAAHCLPHLPPPATISHTHERTYRDLIGPLGAPATITVECAFVDPVADLAVLCGPDGQVYFREFDAFDAFVENRARCPLATLPARLRFSPCPPAPPVDPVDTPVVLLSLAGDWIRGAAVSYGIGLTLTRGKVAGGMSGSPILDVHGAALGVVTVGGGPGGFEPLLTDHLPGWFLRALDAATAAPEA